MISIVVSIIDVLALFALSTEGKNVADKPEFALSVQEAAQVPTESTMVWYNPHEAQIRYEYVFRRLRKRMIFRNGTTFSLDIPRKLDPTKDEKWPFNVPLAEKDKYATVHTRDFISHESANFSQSAGQVTGVTTSGKRLHHYVMARRDKERNACSGSISAISTTGANRSATFCYTDELRDMSCENTKDSETISFKMICSEIRVERFGGNIIPNMDSIWWLSNFARAEIAGTGAISLMQMISLRGYKRDPISPSAIIVAAVLTEYPSQILLVQRSFAVDVSVVIIPNWLVISSSILVFVAVFSSTMVSFYAAAKNLVVLSNWQELFIANLLNPFDSLNRAQKNEFQCIVAESVQDMGRKYQLYIEPDASISPVRWIHRREIE